MRVHSVTPCWCQHEFWISIILIFDPAAQCWSGRALHELQDGYAVYISLHAFWLWSERNWASKSTLRIWYGPNWTLACHSAVISTFSLYIYSKLSYSTTVLYIVLIIWEASIRSRRHSWTDFILSLPCRWMVTYAGERVEFCGRLFRYGLKWILVGSSRVSIGECYRWCFLWHGLLTAC